MNILQVVSSSRTSGAEKHALILSTSLLALGHEVTAVCPAGGWLPGRLKAAGVPAIEMPMHGWRAPGAVLAINRLIKRNRVDLIHTHLTRATYMGYLAGRIARVPVVSTVHVWSRDLAYRHLPGRNHSFVAVSDFVRDTVIARGLPASRVHRVYNGTDFLALASPNPASGLSVYAELGLPPDAELVGLFGRVDEFKGHGLLVEAAKSIVERRPRTYFVLVGHADPSVQQMLWERASELGVADRLRFMGVRDDVSRLMSAMDVITVPSQTETFGMVIVEAMAMSKPVIATRVGGIPEIIEDKETGLLIERTPEALAAAIVELLADPGRRRAMGSAAKTRATDLFSAQAMARNMELLYRRVLDNINPT